MHLLFTTRCTRLLHILSFCLFKWLYSKGEAKARAKCPLPCDSPGAIAIVVIHTMHPLGKWLWFLSLSLTLLASHCTIYTAKDGSGWIGWSTLLPYPSVLCTHRRRMKERKLTLRAIERKEWMRRCKRHWDIKRRMRESLTLWPFILSLSLSLSTDSFA